MVTKVSWGRTSSGMTNAGSSPPRALAAWAGGGRHLGCGRPSSLSRAAVGGGPTGLSSFGSRAWLVGSPEGGAGFRAVARLGWFPSWDERQRATGGVRTKQVGVNPSRRADVGAGVEGPSGACRPLSCGNPAGAASSEEALLAARWLAIAGTARSGGSMVVLVDHENCRSRRTACGPRAPVNSRQGEWV